MGQRHNPPVGDGFKNRSAFYISDLQFEDLCRGIAARYIDLPLDFYPNRMKLGAYMLIRSDGGVYNARKMAAIAHPIIGNLTTDHIAAVAERLALNSTAHSRRYADED